MASSFTADDDDYDRHLDSAKATRLDADFTYSYGHSSTTRSHQTKLDPNLDSFVKKLRNDQVPAPSGEFKPDGKEVSEKPSVEKSEPTKENVTRAFKT